MSETRQGFDQFGEYTEEKTSNGWKKIRRCVEGHEFGLVNPLTHDYMKAIDSTNVILKLNTMSDRIEMQANSRPISDFDEAIIINRLRDYGLKNEPRMRDAIKERSFRNKYHPIQEYFDKLPAWDELDHFAAFINKLTITSPMGATFIRKFLIGSIAKALDAHQNFMLVLLGAQGRGKSRLASWLCPLQRYFYEGPINPDDKDCKIRLISNWLWEVAELDSTTRRSDRSALKYFISQRIVKVRVPYGRYDIEKPAAASMIGTINPDGTGFLNDPTGNRRFAVVHLDDIDWSYTDIDINQLWAQLYAEYRAGAQFELTPQEMEIQNEINNEHMTQSPLEELLIEHYHLDPSQPEKFTSTMEILDRLETLGLRGDQFRNKMELGAVLTRYGLEKVQRREDGKRVYGYAGVWMDKSQIKEIDL